MKLQNKMLVAVAFAISTVGSFAQELEVNLQIRPRFEYRNGFKELMKDNFYPTSFVSQRSRMNFFYKQEKFKEFVLNTLDSLNLEEIKTAIGKIKITKSTSTIVEESKLGTDCFDYIQKRKTIKEIESLGYKLEKQINRKVSFK